VRAAGGFAAQISPRLEIYFTGAMKINHRRGAMLVFLSVIYSTQQSEARNENVSFPSTPESALYIFLAQL
jgi:hypothetical protein